MWNPLSSKFLHEHVPKDAAPDHQQILRAMASLASGTATASATTTSSSLPSFESGGNRNWMEKWDEPCDKLCCATSPSDCPCGDVCCSSCGHSIVRPQGATTLSMNGHAPGTRFVCLDCEVDVEVS